MYLDLEEQRIFLQNKTNFYYKITLKFLENKDIDEGNTITTQNQTFLFVEKQKYFQSFETFLIFIIKYLIVLVQQDDKVIYQQNYRVAREVILDIGRVNIYKQR